MSLKKVQFGLGDGDMIWPVVGDGPVGNIVFDRPPDTRRRPNLGMVVEVARQHAAPGTPATIEAAIGARLGHASIIARTSQIQNDRFAAVGSTDRRNTSNLRG
jgi:hypothetical protein